MKLQQDLQVLASRIAAAQSAERPYLLVLGSSCAEAAGLPSLNDLSKQNDIEVGPGDRGLIERMLYAFPVPTFYLDLANLARAGYFPRIISTGYDNLVERALFDLGLRPGHHFESLDLFARRSQQPWDPTGRLDRIRIVHAYGQADDAFDPVRLSQMVAPVGRATLDVVVVGYRSETKAIERWLSTQSAGDLWWVSDETTISISWLGRRQEISGEDGAAETFFGKLSLLLSTAISAGSDADHDESFAQLAASGAEDLDYAFAKKRLDQLYATRGSIEQRASSSGVDPAAASQLEYQNREIATFEQRVAKQQATDLFVKMKDYAEKLEAAAADPASPVQPETFSFFQQQLNLLMAETEKLLPNRTIVIGLQQLLEGIARDVGAVDQRPEPAK
ncbi:MAG TPA: hypothetical protein VGQ64_02760 [Candidatus Limnocylindrales bacterium]|nr:hypothetical protein [Candidatus Limnocylindrales bacterium]